MLFITTASGEKHRKMAEDLKKSFEKYNWSKLIVVTDLTHPEKDDLQKGRGLKTRFADFIPEDYVGAVAFLDCDCIVTGEYKEIKLEENTIHGVISRKYMGADKEIHHLLCSCFIAFPSVEMAKDVCQKWYEKLKLVKNIQTDEICLLFATKGMKAKRIGTSINPIENLTHFFSTKKGDRTKNIEQEITQPKKKFAATALILNWKRKENLIKTIQSIKSQDVPIEIFLWNNNKNDNHNYDVDLKIDSSENLMCMPRWFLSQFASSDYVFSIDDDKLLSKTSTIKECIDFVQKENSTICYAGVCLPENKDHLGKNDYFRLKHVKTNPNLNQKVDILKGSFIFSTKQKIIDSITGINIDIENPKIEDDILISSKIEGEKICPSFLHGCIKELPEGRESLTLQHGHAQQRADAVNEYFY
jgi:hypothetical protein